MNSLEKYFAKKLLITKLAQNAHTQGHVSIGPAKVTPTAKVAPNKQFNMFAPKPSGINVKMQAGKGYGHLARQINRQATTGGFGALKGVTSAELKKRMGGQMLYKNKAYSFNPLNVAGGGKDAVSGGLSAKQQGRAQRAGAAWRGGGRAKFLAARKAKQTGQAEPRIAPQAPPPSDEQVSAMGSRASDLSRTGEHLRDLRAHASQKHEPGQESASLTEARAKAVENKRPAVKPRSSSGPLLRGTQKDADDFIATQKRFAERQQDMHTVRHGQLDQAHGRRRTTASDRLAVNAEAAGRKVLRYKIVDGKRVPVTAADIGRVRSAEPQGQHYEGDGHNH
jgi:hypothetical protein